MSRILMISGSSDSPMDTKYQEALRKLGVPAECIMCTDYERVLRPDKNSKGVRTRPDLLDAETRRLMLVTLEQEQAELLELLGDVSIAHVELSFTVAGAREVVATIKRYFPSCEVVCVAHMQESPQTIDRYRAAVQSWGASLLVTCEADPKREERFVDIVQEPVSSLVTRLRQKTTAPRTVGAPAEERELVTA